MQESVIYQDILQRGLQQGRQEGRQEEAISLLMRLFTRRFGALEPQLQERIRGLPLSQLEELGEALLDFETAADLTGWLEKRQLVCLLWRQLSHRFGEIEPHYRQRVRELSIAQLEELGEALLDFEAVTDLAVWLDECQAEEESDRTNSSN